MKRARILGSDIDPTSGLLRVAGLKDSRSRHTVLGARRRRALTVR
jgi:hypothetical protein